MKKNMITKFTIILILVSASICVAKENQYNNELEFGNPSAKRVLQIGGNGDLNITGYNGDKVLISAGKDIFDESDTRDEKAKGLKRIRGGGFNIINNKKDNIIYITRPINDDVDLNISVPNGITLKLGNGVALKNQNLNLKKLNKQSEKQNSELEEKAEKLKGLEAELKEKETELNAFDKSMQQVVQKIQENLNISISAPVVTGLSRFAHSTGIIDGNISIRDFTGVIEVSTVNGRITAQNITGEAVASTVDGEINISFKRVNKDSSLYFSTVDGDIDITLPKEAKADIMARTMDGDVYTGFDTDLVFGGEIDGRKGGAFQNYMNPFFNSNNITARINGGGNKVYLNTINGNIYIRKGE
ncbi:MAG: DUF4097 family beta strand repeat protein [Desulfatiglans sp.]|jgi:hypothetical protein|nr:DUF4097 family beta strand repeat protein [Desulfatiglans sp.]